MPNQKKENDETRTEEAPGGEAGDSATTATGVEQPGEVVEETPSPAMTEDDAPAAPPFGGARTEKLRFLESVTTDVGAFTEGQTADVPAGVAGQLVSDGKAEYVT